MAHQGEVTDTAKIKIIDEIPFGINGHNTASHTHIPVFLRPKFVDHTSTHVVDRSHCGSAHTPRGQRCGGGEYECVWWTVAMEVASFKV